MVVTSQKREQNLLDVPSALQAFSGDMLEDAGVRDTNDLTRMVPDMLMSGEDSGRANIWLRELVQQSLTLVPRAQMLFL